jgi:hypothetical protein
MWPATKVSRALLLICVLNSIVPFRRILICVWPFAIDVEPVVSFFARSFACRTFGGRFYRLGAPEVSGFAGRIGFPRWARGGS